MRWFSPRAALITATIVIARAMPSLAQTTISVPIGSSIANNADFFGVSRVGQTFTTPTIDYLLQSFQFRVNEAGTPSQLLFEIFAWNGAAATGSALFSSAMSIPSNEIITVAVGGLALTPGQVYVALLSETSGQDWGVWRRFDDVYAGGQFVEQSTSGAWTAYAADALFQADFTGPVTATPEPGSIVLLGTGLVGVSVVRRRRRARS